MVSNVPPCRYGEACQIVTNSTEILVTHMTGTDAGGWITGCEKRHLFLNFPYVRPEPVLAK
jgi:hypothetical protein